ncbi:MAG: hypothetical protein K2H70_02395 [Bacteroidales bacterium]|nr:hypothetical protein [Bacteroidales bacterium]
MKKLFALIGLLGLVTGMGGTLNAQETLDRVGLWGHFAEGGVGKAIKFKFSAMPGDKFVVACGQDKDTITAEADITEFSHTFSPDLIKVNIELSSLNQTSHLHHFEMDSTDHYSTIDFENCPMLKSIHVTHNTFENFTFRNCPALTFLDCSYNKITSLYYLDLFACKALTDLTVRDNDSLKTLNVSNLPLQHLTCTECQNLSEINADNCRLQTLDVSGNPALKRLDFIDNQLTSLILKDCPVLERLFCANNRPLFWRVCGNNAKMPHSIPN